MILGFSGWPGVGKTYLVNYLLESLPKYAKISFGSFLKEEASEVFDYPNEWNYSQEGKEMLVTIPNWPYPNGDQPRVMSVREILQWFGSEYLFQKDPTCLVKRAKIAMRNRTNIIFDDVRDETEARFIKSLGGSLLRIQPYEGWEPSLACNHPREHLLDKYLEWDATLYPQFGKLKTFSIEMVEWIKDRE